MYINDDKKVLTNQYFSSRHKNVSLSFSNNNGYLSFNWSLNVKTGILIIGNKVFSTISFFEKRRLNITEYQERQNRHYGYPVDKFFYFHNPTYLGASPLDIDKIITGSISFKRNTDIFFNFTYYQLCYGLSLPDCYSGQWSLSLCYRLNELGELEIRNCNEYYYRCDCNNEYKNINKKL